MQASLRLTARQIFPMQSTFDSTKETENYWFIAFCRRSVPLPSVAAPGTNSGRLGMIGEAIGAAGRIGRSNPRKAAHFRKTLAYEECGKVSGAWILANWSARTVRM